MISRLLHQRCSMARKSGYKWLEQIVLYIHSQEEIFAYIGTPINPRSSAIKIQKNRVYEPVRLPPISIESLNQRHPNANEFQLKDTSLSIKIKFLYAFFLRNEELFQTSLNENDKDYYLETNEKLKSLGPEILLHSVYKPKDFDKWFVKRKRPTPIFDAFIRVFSRSNRHSRQLGLTQIVTELTERKELPKSFLLLLLDIRRELTISVFRELGRQQKFISPFPEIAEYYFENTDNPELKKYVFYYLLAHNSKIIGVSNLFKDFQVNLTIFTSISVGERTKQIISNLQSDIVIAKTSLHGIIGLNSNELSELLLSIYNSFSVSKKIRENIRVASLFVLKIIEFYPNPEVTGFILALNTMGMSSDVFEDDKKVAHIKVKHGPTHFTSKYVVRRANKLLELWNTIGFDDYISRALKFYIQHIPPEVTKIEKRRISINRRLIGNWQLEHAVIKKFGTKITSLLGEDKLQLHKSITTQAKLNNRFALEWLDTSFRSKTHIQALERATGEDILSLYVTELPKKLTKIISNIIEEKQDLQIQEWDEVNLDEHQLIKIISFFSTTQTFMPVTLFTYIITLIFDEKYLDIGEIKAYTTSINHNQHQEISQKYLEIIFDIIESRVYEKIENPSVIEFCTDYVIEWEKITFRKVREEDQYKFDALRIVFEKQLKANKPNTWDDISVETISYVYRLLKLHVPSLIDGSLQYAMNKPNWEQLARHYLAMGMVRPLNSEIKKTRLKDVPTHLLRDIEGLIALITETILYSERNGYNIALENLLIQHLYRRGWNIDRNIARKLPGLFGNISPRLRSYFAAYLVFEQGEVSNDVLKFARDINNYQLRERVLRTLDRYATPDMLLVLAESKFEDLAKASVKKFSDARILTPEKKLLVSKLLQSTNIDLRTIGKQWMEDLDLRPETVLNNIVVYYEDMYDFYFNQFDRIRNFNEKNSKAIYLFFKYLIWQPKIKNKWLHRILSIIGVISQQNVFSDSIKNELSDLMNTQIQNRVDIILPTLTEVVKV